MKSLTKAEEEIMQIIWDLGQASVKEVISAMPEPKPAYNTVSTIIRILEQKEVLGHKPQGKGYIYFPLLARVDYRNTSLNRLVGSYFNGSLKSLVSSFISDNDIKSSELDEILKLIESKKKK